MILSNKDILLDGDAGDVDDVRPELPGMKKLPTFSVDERRMQKERDREADIARVDSGEITGEELNGRNGFFSALDRTTVRIVTWRKRVKLD